MVGGGLKDFASRPKREDRTLIGKMLTDPILNCICMYDLEEQITHTEKQPVDFVWEYLSFGFECKHFYKKGSFYGEDYPVNKYFLQKEVIDRFEQQEQILGKPMKYRALVVNERRWDKELDCWLSAQGIHVLEVGDVDSRLEVTQAMMIFMCWFENMVWRICNGELKQEWAG